MKLWLAVLEATDGSWNDDPIGTYSKKDTIELAKKEWPTCSTKSGERIALYRCDYQEDIAVPETPDEVEIAIPVGV